MAGIFDCKQSEADASARFAAKEYIDRIRQLEADLAAAREDVDLYRIVARTGTIIRPRVDPRTTAAWFATGGEFSIFEAGDTESEVLSKAVAAIEAARAGGGR